MLAAGGEKEIFTSVEDEDIEKERNIRESVKDTRGKALDNI